MSVSRKKLDNEIRKDYMELIKNFLESREDEILITGSNEYSIPCVDSQNNERFLVLTFKIPTGSRDGDMYDGYAVAEEYKIKCIEKEEKAKKKKAEIEKKKERDKKQRELNKKVKEEKAKQK